MFGQRTSRVERTIIYTFALLALGLGLGWALAPWCGYAVIPMWLWAMWVIWLRPQDRDTHGRFVAILIGLSVAFTPLACTKQIGSGEQILALQNTFAQAPGRIDTVDTTVATAATQTGDAATAISTAARDGKAVTLKVAQPDQAAKITPFFDTIGNWAQKLLGVRDDLTGVRVELQALRADVAAGQAAQKLMGEKITGLEQDKSDLADELAAVKNEFQTKLMWWRIIISVLGAVVAGILFAWTRIRMAIGVIIGTAFVVCILWVFGQIDLYLWWILGGIGSVALLYQLGDTLYRKTPTLTWGQAFVQALITPPGEDWKPAAPKGL